MTFDEATQIYYFDGFQIHEDDLSGAIHSYVTAGEDRTQAEVASSLNLTVKQVADMFRSVGVSKGSEPFTPRQARTLSPTQKRELRAKRRVSSGEMKHLRDRVKALQAELDKSDDRRAYVEAIRTAILATTTPAPAGNARAARNSPSSGVVVFCLQDWHCGAVSKPNMTFKGFNQTIFESRIGSMRTAIANFKPELSAAPAPLLLFNGDLLDDYTSSMHFDQIHNQDSRGIEQIRLCAEAIVALVRTAVQTFAGQVVTVHALAGNHDRGHAKSEGDPIRLGHWIVWEIVRARLTEYLDRGVVALLVPDRKVSAIYESNEVRILAFHGDIKAKIDNILHSDAMNGPGYRILLQGHTHRRYVQEGAGHIHVMMPSLMGASNFSEEMGWASRPGQGILEVAVVNGEFLTSIRFIDLL